MQLVIYKAEEIFQNDFKGESRRQSRKTTARAKAFSKALEAWIKKEARKQIKAILTEIRSKGLRAFVPVSKAVIWDDVTLLRILQLYGVRQLTDSGKEFAGTAWKFTPTASASFAAESKVAVQGIRRGLEKEMQHSVGAAMGTWMAKEPGLTTNQIAGRLRGWLLVPTAKDTPAILKPLGQRFTSHGIGARARMIARTETNKARNRGRLEAGKVMGATQYMWLAETDGMSGDRQHDALNMQVRRAGESFVNPATGVALEYPGDPGADVEEIVNCRCSIRPLSPEQAADFI